MPLESRVDYLTLQTGQKFELPFMTLVVFATNIRPRELVDEAFLRRIHYKVFAESPSVDDFAQIFEPLPAPSAASPSTRRWSTASSPSTTARGRSPLRGCHPRDLIDQALSLAEYRGEPTRLDLRPARRGLRQLFRRRRRELIRCASG